MASVRQTQAPKYESQATAAAAMIFPLAMAWAYLVALGEKLHDSLYGNSTRPSCATWPSATSTPPETSNSSNSSSSSGSKSNNLSKTGSSRHHPKAEGAQDGRSFDASDAQRSIHHHYPHLPTPPQQQRQHNNSKRNPNRLEFSLGDFLRSKLYDPFISTAGSTSGGVQSQPRSPTETRSSAVTAPPSMVHRSGTVPPASHTPSSRSLPWYLRLRARISKQYQQQRQPQQEQQEQLHHYQQQEQGKQEQQHSQVKQEKEHQEKQGEQQHQQQHLLPPVATCVRPRATDKTLVLDLDETLIHAREHLTGDDRFDFMVVLPPRRREQPLPLCEAHGNIAISDNGNHIRNINHNISTSSSSGSSSSSNGSTSSACTSCRCNGSRSTGGSGNVADRNSTSAKAPPSSSGGGGGGGVEVGRRIYVRKRPHLREFLEAVSKQFEVVLFTAARAEFARAVLDEIDPGRELVDHVLSRESCTRLKLQRNSRKKSGRFRFRGRSQPRKGDGNVRRKSRGATTTVVKDLGIIGRPLSKVIMVENSCDVIRFYLENCVHISSFYGDRFDTQLLSTLESLKPLAPAEDVRDGIIRLYVQDRAIKEGHTLPPGALPPPARAPMCASDLPVRIVEAAS